jgi:hypothetical protein
MLKNSTLLFVVGLIAAAALVHGAVTQRWGVFEPDPALTTRLHALEVRFEDWHPTEVPTEMPTNERSTATSRRYVSASSGRSAVVSMISGIPGSVSTHTPDVCYPGSGYRTCVAARRQTTELPGGKVATFYVADFEKRTATRQDRARVRWAWSTDGTWVAPDSPRWQFAKQLTAVPVLYKLYIVTPLPDESEERVEDDPATAAFVTAAWVQYAAAFGK